MMMLISLTLFLILQGGTLAPFLFMIYLYYVLQTSVDLMKENCFTLKQVRSRQYPGETIISVNCTDDLVLLAKTSAQAKSLLYSLEPTERSIGLYMNSSKTEFMCLIKSVPSTH